MRQVVVARFWSHVDRHGPIHPILKTRCWIWIASLGSSGYGQFKLDGKYKVAHRVSWLIEHGAWPDPCALHKCDVRICVRPLHLFEGTLLENIQDMKEKGRARSGGCFGETHGMARITEATVRLLRKRASTGKFTQDQLASEFGISQPHVSDILRGMKWSHVE